MSDVVVVLSTVPNDESAEKIARTLVEEKLAACVNVHSPMTSIYHWNGAVERDTERQLVMKTTRACVDALKERLTELHSYDLPEFIVLHADGGSAAYLAWVESSLK
jgi:periplasmic divalent cation tolerance protein